MPILAKLQRINSEDARQFAYRILKFSILELLLHPGEKLNEAELAGSLSMSRTPVHDVIGRLSRENLVEQIPQRGAFVARIHPARAEQAAWSQSQTGTAVLEVLYTQRISPAELELLQQNLAKQQFCIATDDRDRAVRIAIDFYRILYQIAHLDMVWASLECAGADLRRLAHLVGTQEGSCESTLLECRAILDAIEHHDHATACRALQHQFVRICSQMPVLQEKQPEFFEVNEAG